MILRVIWVQRANSYPGEYAPEAMECMTEYAYEDNPGWLDEKAREYRAQLDVYSSVMIIDLEVSTEKITRILNNECESLPTKVRAPKP